MTREKSDTELVRLFRGAMQMVSEMRERDCSVQEIQQALTRSVKAMLRPIPESEWPYWALVPRCIHCDGYGYVIRAVRNRLGQDVTEATPCTCEKGRHLNRKKDTEADFTAAGKTPAKPRGFTRWNG